MSDDQQGVDEAAGDETVDEATTDEATDETTDETATDEASTTEAPTDESPSEAAPARRPASPGATAASRARRIGGRPMPTPKSAEERDREVVTGATGAPAKSPAAKQVATKAAPAAKAATKAAPAAKAASATPAEPVERRRPLPVDVVAMQRRLDRMRWIPAIIAGVIVVALLVVGAAQSNGVWWGSNLHDNRAEQQQRVLAAAKQCAVAILSYDYRKLDVAQNSAIACMTPDFKTSQYDPTFKVVQQLAPQKKATLSLQIAYGGVRSVSKDGQQWVVLLYGQEAYADSSTSQRLDLSSPVVTLNNVDGKWLVSNMATTG